jgi:crossover junction endodeoxyribonuclease RuvC
MQRVLGIDPGLRITGYGAVALAVGRREPTLIEAGVIRLSAKSSLEERLAQLFTDLTSLIVELEPTAVAVEKLYAHYKHPRTAILMAHARGVILLAAQQHDLPLIHLPATEVKKAVTGYGHASKEQMQRAVQGQMGLAELPKPPDVADAIAIALTAARRLTQNLA